jgi:Pin2-interacting protein X1
MKLSHDPNNTTWTNDTQSFGHKIMTSQGWQPGQYLGAQDAAHAEFHTAANASHIRVTIKDDNLGIGAKIGSGVGHGECTGLDVFKNILGRLNGKEEDEIEQEQKSREDLRRAIYTERRWGSIRFVPGGFLIGDKIQHLIDGEAERIRKLAAGTSGGTSDSDTSSEEEAPVPVEKTKKSKKRKIEVLDEGLEVVAVEVRKSKKKSKLEGDSEASETSSSQVVKSKKSKKERKAKKGVEESGIESEKQQRKREKKGKKQGKEEEKARKEKTSKSEAEDSRTSKKSKREKRKDIISMPESGELSDSHLTSAPSLPATAPSSGQSTPMLQGRHAVRARNIAQKRLASMDVASLNQVSPYYILLIF